MSESIADEFGRDRARGATGVLAEFNTAGALGPADVHVARRLGALGGEDGEPVLLAAALAVRAVRLGSVCLDLTLLPTPAGPAAPLLVDDGPEPTWPVVTDWAATVGASPLAAADGPLHLDGERLYLDRYWQEETQVLEDLGARAAGAPAVDEDVLAASLARYFPDEDYADQRDAAATAARSWTSVITGGPGTGKTTTVARLLGVLLDQDPTLRIGLAAPTGKAAARMAEAVRQAAGHESFPATHAAAITALPSSTLHRLLGSLPDRRTRFRHHRGNRLPLDVVVLDETSMVSLTLMARLLEAMRPQARLVLVGDADQLASVEAGAVLGDLVRGLEGRPGRPVATLERSRRFGGDIGDLAAAVQAGDAEGAQELLGAGAVVGYASRDSLHETLLGPALRLRELAEAGEREAALAALEGHKLLCAHRDGPAGVSHWNRQTEQWLEQRTGERLGHWYAGQPLIVTANDYGLGLFNGDTGVVVRGPEGLVAVFADGEHPAGREYALARLSDVATAHALTVHRAQGSQFDRVTVLLPDADSRVLTRELLYTAITRARERVRLVGDPAVVDVAVHRHTGRATGLADRLR